MKSFAVCVPYEKYGVAQLRRDMLLNSWKSTMLDDSLSKYVTMHTDPFALEIVHSKQSTMMCFTAHAETADYFHGVFYSIFPNGKIVEVPDPMYAIDESSRIGMYELKCRRKSIVPFRTYKNLQVGSMDPILGALTHFPRDGVFIIQIVCSPRRDTLTHHARLALHKFIEKGKELLTPKYAFDKSRLKEKWELLQQKSSACTYDVNLRIAAILPTPLSEGMQEPRHYLDRMVASYSELSDQDLNGYEVRKHSERWSDFKNFQQRELTRPMLHSTTELTSIWHVPSISDSNNIQKNLFHELSPGPDIPKTDDSNNDDVQVLAINEYRSQREPIALTRSDRAQNMLIAGKPGTGKAQFVRKIFCDDIRRGCGTTLVDYQGLVTEGVLAELSESELQKVQLIDLTESTLSLSFNPLSDIPLHAHGVYTQELVDIFEFYFKAEWSDSAEEILHYSLLTLLKMPGASLAAIPLLLLDQNYRDYVMTECGESALRYFWQHEFPKAYDNGAHEVVKSTAELLKRLLSTDELRRIFSQPVDKLDIPQALKDNRCILFKCPSERRESSEITLITSLFIHKFLTCSAHALTMNKIEAHNHSLYIADPSNGVLERTRKRLFDKSAMRLPLHVVLQQMPEVEDLRSDFFAHFGAHVCFRLSTEDAQKCAMLFEPKADMQNLVNLPDDHFYMKCSVNGKPIDPISGRSFENTKEARQLTEGQRLELLKKTSQEIAEAEKIAEMWQIDRQAS